MEYTGIRTFFSSRNRAHSPSKHPTDNSNKKLRIERKVFGNSLLIIATKKKVSKDTYTNISLINVIL